MTMNSFKALFTFVVVGEPSSQSDLLFCLSVGFWDQTIVCLIHRDILIMEILTRHLLARQFLNVKMLMSHCSSAFYCGVADLSLI